MTTKFKTKLKIRKPEKIRKKGIRKSKRKKEQFFAFSGGNSEVSKYTKGAFVGGLVGGIGGLLIGKKIILGIIVGALAGGYISYEIDKQK